jgi:hypothetical protein
MHYVLSVCQSVCLFVCLSVCLSDIPLPVDSDLITTPHTLSLHTLNFLSPLLQASLVLSSVSQVSWVMIPTFLPTHTRLSVVQFHPSLHTPSAVVGVSFTHQPHICMICQPNKSPITAHMSMLIFYLILYHCLHVLLSSYP